MQIGRSGFGLCMTLLPWLVMAVPALAQQKPPSYPPMEIRIVQGAAEGCEPTCIQWIALKGYVTKDAPRRLERLIQSLKGRKLPILLHSPGGDVDAGIAMGRMVRKAGLVTVVADSTLPTPCAPKDAACRKSQASKMHSGRFDLRRAYCASACTFILAGGVRRVIHPYARVGLHQITVFRNYKRVRQIYQTRWRMVNGKRVVISRTLVSEKVISNNTRKLDKTPSSSVQQVERHYAAMGLPPDVADKMKATPADKMHFLTEYEMRTFKVATHDRDFIPAIGFNPEDHYFTRPNGTSPYVGYRLAKLDDSEVMLKFIADPALKADDTPITIQILKGDKPIDPGEVFLEVSLPPLLKSSAVKIVEDTAASFRVNLQRRNFCEVTRGGLATISVSDKAEPERVRLLKAGARVDVMPIQELRETLCPPDIWK